MNEKKRLLENTGLIALGNFGAKAVSFLLLPLYTSILTTEEYGIYDYIVALSAFLFPIVTMCMQEAMFRFIIDTGSLGENFKRVVTNCFIVILFNIVILSIIMTIIYFIFEFEYTFYLLLFIIANVLYSFGNNLLRGQGKIKQYAVITSGKNILTVLVNVLMIVVFRMGVVGLFVSLILSEILAFIIVFICSQLWKNIRFRAVELKLIKEMLYYSLPLIPNSLSASIINISDRIVINHCLGPDLNGIYSISYKFPNIVETVYHYFYTAWAESASRVFAKGKEDATEYYRSLHKTINNFIYSVVLLMISFMPVLYRIFVKGDYIEGFLYVPVLLLAMYLDSMGKFYSGIYTALKKTKVMAISTIVAAIINIIFNVSLIHWWGLYAAAIGSLIANLSLVCVRHLYIKKDYNIFWSAKDIVIKTSIFLIIYILYDYYDWKQTVISIIISSIYLFISNYEVIIGIGRKVFKKR